MEVNYVVSVWQLVSALVAITTGFAMNTYMTRDNNRKIKTLEEKCNEMMKIETAKETFVSKELYQNEVQHLNKILDEVKEQNREILSYVRK